MIFMRKHINLYLLLLSENQFLKSLCYAKYDHFNFETIMIRYIHRESVIDLKSFVRKLC